MEFSQGTKSCSVDVGLEISTGISKASGKVLLSWSVRDEDIGCVVRSFVA